MNQDSNQYNTYNHFDPSISTVGELVSSSLSKIYGWTVGGLLGYEADTGKTNLERLYEMYRFSDYPDSKVAFDLKSQSDISRLKAMPVGSRDSFIPTYDKLLSGTVLLIPVNRYCKKMLFSRVGAVKSKDGTELSSMLEAEIARAITIDIGALRIDAPKVSVFLWTKASTQGHLRGRLLDITPLLLSVSTSKTNVSGNFTLSVSMSMLEAESSSGAGAFSEYAISSDSSKSYSDRLFEEHSVVFISYNGIDTGASIGRLEIDKSYINHERFDMIGVVTKCTKVSSSMASRLSVSGGDLSQILSKDNSELFSQRYISGGQVRSLANYDGGILRFMGKFISAFQLKDQSIEDQIRFTIDHQSRMVVAEDLFDGYPDRMKIPVPEYDLISQPVSGVWKAIDVIVDKSVSHLRSFNSEIGNASDNLMSQISNFIAEPFSELLLDTYGNKFYITARRSPLNGEAIMSIYNSGKFVSIGDHEIKSVNISQSSERYSWYSIDYKMMSEVFKNDLNWLFPAVHFKEYSDIWGDVSKKAVNPYMDFSMKIFDADDKPQHYDMARRMISELRFLIQCSMYLPFTYDGSITVSINRGIRVGSWIKAYGMMFYVTGISSNINPTTSSTSIQVSRGMYVDLLSDYFSVIDLPDDATASDFSGYVDKTLSSWTVNQRTFNKLIDRVHYAG